MIKLLPSTRENSLSFLNIKYKILIYWTYIFRVLLRYQIDFKEQATRINKINWINFLIIY